MWVPFDLGRPLGVPNDPAFQKRVLLSALRLLELSSGPVLQDFSEDAPDAGIEGGPLACPVDFGKIDHTMSDVDQMVNSFKEEMAQMRNWYDCAVQKRGRTTVGTSGLEPEEVAEFLAGFVLGDRESNPVANVSLANALRLVAEDLKAYYLESLSIQPGQSMDGVALVGWFWSRTMAAQIINAIREICLTISNSELRLLGKLQLIPRNQLHNFQG